MEYWKQRPDKARQQPQQASQQQKPQKQQQQTPNQSKRSQPKGILDPNTTEQSSADPIQSIANVLNHHHSKVVYEQKKLQHLDEPTTSGSKNKLEQSARDKTTSSRGNGNGSHLLQLEQQNKLPKKGESSSQDSSSSLSCSHISNQVDQGNSYLYAYNDFVTSTRAQEKGSRVVPGATSSGIHKSCVEQQFAAGGEPLNSNNKLARKLVIAANLSDNQATGALPSRISDFNNHQETLIDSDEDDTFSYILHQHRPLTHHNHELLHHLKCSSKQLSQNYHISDAITAEQLHHNQHLSNLAQYLQSEESLDSFEANKIDHHLSCSRSSHPRHICGIGASKNEQSNHLAARLKEESQRAFLLNQKHHNHNNPTAATNYLRNGNIGHHNCISEEDITAIQNHNFTHELNVIQDQLAYELSAAAKVAQRSNNQQQADKLSSPSLKYLDNPNNDLCLIRGVGDNLALQQAAHCSLNQSSELTTDSSSDQSRPALLPRSQRSGGGVLDSRRISNHNPGYLSWLFCCICNLFSSQLSRQHNSANITNLPIDVAANVRGKKIKRKKLRSTNASSSILTMYSNSQPLNGLGQQLGQAGAYYTSQQAGGDHNAHHHHPHTTYTNHGHHYPLSSDSSLGSSVLAGSAQRMNAFFKTCCSKKCLFVGCMSVIVLIFIFVFGLNFYLNLLINQSKTNLMPLSGRLRVETQGDAFNNQLMNRTSIEFLTKQQQYETILRGAFDRTQNLLKSYPNHLVKCEVYAFKSGSLWVHFRLFINKRTLMQDNMLMKRKSPDESLDKQFLPRLTQQTLHSGFEQLVTTFSARNNPATERRSRSAQAPSSTAAASEYGARQSRAADGRLSAAAALQQESVKSFDEQISRLMPIIQSIDLQSIQVSPEFDMLVSTNTNPSQQSTSDKFQRVPEYLTTPNQAIMVATGDPKKSLPEYELASTTETSSSSTTASSATSPPTTTTGYDPTRSTSTTSRKETTQSGETSTNKFTLINYRENSTRPSTSTRPATQAPSAESPFLVHQQRKPQIVVAQPKPKQQTEARQSNTMKEINAARQLETEPKQKVVKLVSGQPVISQNPLQRNPVSETEVVSLSEPNKTLSLFNQFQRDTATSSLGSPPSPTTNDRRANLHREKTYNDTSGMQMIAPYQKVEFSTQASGGSSNSLPSSVRDFWDSVTPNDRKNVTSSNRPNRLESEQPKRLITISTPNLSENDKDRSSANNGSNSSGSNWSRVSVFSPEISNTIRANINAQLPTSSTTAPTPTPSQKPKVAPHLHHGGSLISAPAKKQQQDSAVLLNRDITQINNEGQQIATANATQSSSRNWNQKSTRKPQAGSQRASNSNTAEVQKQRQSKPKQQKPKVVSTDNQQLIAKNENNNGTQINSKGIRIVDNFLASIDSADIGATADKAINQADPSTRNRTSQQPPQPTLPTTIELTRSTTAQPATRTTSSHRQANESSHPKVASNVEYTTTSSSSPSFTTSTGTITDSPVKLATATSNTTSTFSSHTAKPQGSSQFQSANGNTLQAFGGAPTNRPGTTNFSNQWKPLSANGTTNGAGAVSSSPSSRRPNLSLIIGTERLPQTVNAPSNQGSQSPFAMSTAIFDSQFRSSNGRNSNSAANSNNRRVNKQLVGNTYQATNIANNEFESHRVARMRQNSNHDSSASFGASTTPTSTTTSSSNLDPTTRIVDDFMITADKIEGNTRGSTLLPPLVLSGLQRIDPLARMRAMNPIDLQPQRTRGPFAFETLRASSDTTLTEATSDEPSALVEPTSSRSERSPKVMGADQKLLVRKKLFLGAGEEEFSVSTPSDLEIVGNPLKAETGAFDRFGKRTRQQTEPLMGLTGESSGSAAINRLVLGDRFSPNNNNNSVRCQYYGCKARGSQEYTCLNNSQICDDFIDCQDESDEFDCVSLLKHDSKSSNRLTFSNGEGIIYLNRKGSLAPMCIDYFAAPTKETTRVATSTAHDLDAIQIEMAKKQQELIRQINTIGQYACSLQSFSRLVSVKINHHSLVDETNLIKNSKLFHRLSIVGQSDKSEKSLDASSGTYKSANSEYEVEISSANDCPSQRTVFVKCGSFDCGKDTFSIMDQSNMSKRRNEVILNDFPWLVKLYWQGSLTCHGYLIDESWLITSEECFANNNSSNADDWTAEISYEHYGNDDYKSIETNRRRIKSIIQQQAGDQADGLKQIIVLANLEKPVRFSPLNRPICLPTPRNGNTTMDHSAHSSLDRTYRDCVAVTLPVGGSSSSAQDLLLSKVQVLDTNECLSGGKFAGYAGEFICTSELNLNGSKFEDVTKPSTHVLICSTSQSSRARPKWTIVGVQNKALEVGLPAGRQVFTSVSGKIDWIVDTMNPTMSANLFIGDAIEDDTNSSINSNRASQSCNLFRCSSGECLSWSRICDGLYDCSSHDDEKDCHK